ncbi:DUF5610 domain-containing protein [Hydrogenovibrio kuenenii]|uniref:DUF5610 domain-containing protein n=1 Tax=Hydrogenovibrio kuenenii TaxID=63658 RepID=UPI0004662A4D|nr:DUF5610 domain-containing protein [Hydrogenovibrio kuenenii]
MAATTITDLVQTYQNNANQTNNKAKGLDIAAQRAAQYGVEISSSKSSQQSSIVTSLFSNKESAPSDALKMTYQAAISKLNEILSADAKATGETSTDKSKNNSDTAPISEKNLKKQGGIEYWSPENTANRIVSGSTAFLNGFQKIHPELQGQALMDKFNEVVGGGLKQGFDEAKGILSDLKVFDGQIKDNFNSTWDLVTKGMTDFTNKYLGITPTQTASTDTESAADNASKTDEKDA